MKKIILTVAALVVAALAYAGPAEARSHHRKHHYSSARHHVVKNHRVRRAFYAPQSRMLRHRHHFGHYAQVVERNTNLVAEARQFIGASAGQLGLPRSLWCADFMNMLVGGSDRRAISFLRRGRPAHYGCVNCVAVTSRRGGGHVGIVSGYDQRGNPILISGNHGRRVGVGAYARSRVIAYRYV